jgi:hypothetical protein
MLKRIFVICVCGAVLLYACKPAMESKLVGSWRAKTADDAGDIQFRSDHTFTSREWPVTYSHQPPVLSDAGEWHVSKDKLVLDFAGDTHPPDARHVEFSLVMRDQNYFTIRQANGLETTLERLK